jgi:hypothetical protein
MVVTLRLGDLLCCPHRTPVEVDETSVRHRMRKHHTAPPPIPYGMWPGAWRRIADIVLLRQGQGNAALPQVRFPAAPWQGRLEGGELLGEVGAGWGRRTWDGGIYGVRPGCCRWRAGELWWHLSTMWNALPLDRRFLQSRLPLLLLSPLRTSRLHIAPGSAGKTHEATAMHLHPQAALAVRAVKGV